MRNGTTVVGGQLLPVQLESLLVGKGSQGKIVRLTAVSTNAILQLKPASGQLVAKLPHTQGHQAVVSDIVTLLKLQEIDPDGKHHWPVHSFLYHPEITLNEVHPRKLTGYIMAEAEGDLWDVYQTNRYPINTIHQFCRSILASLEYIHHGKMAHGDVTAKNVLVAKGQARLSDCVGIDLTKHQLDQLPHCTPRSLPPSIYSRSDSLTTQTWVHADKYGWVVMTLLDLNPDNPQIPNGKMLASEIERFKGHPLWPAVVAIMNEEYKRQGVSKQLDIPLHQAVAYEVECGIQRASNFLDDLMRSPLF